MQVLRVGIARGYYRGWDVTGPPGLYDVVMAGWDFCRPCRGVMPSAAEPRAFARGYYLAGPPGLYIGGVRRSDFGWRRYFCANGPREMAGLIGGVRRGDVGWRRYFCANEAREMAGLL